MGIPGQRKTSALSNPSQTPLESTAAAWHDFHYAALQRDRNIAKSLSRIGQQIDTVTALADSCPRQATLSQRGPDIWNGRRRTAPPSPPADQKKPSFLGL
jgi:hypothetical protein